MALKDLALLLVSHVTLDKSQDLSEPLFAPLCKGVIAHCC